MVGGDWLRNLLTAHAEAAQKLCSPLLLVSTGDKCGLPIGSYHSQTLLASFEK